MLELKKTPILLIGLLSITCSFFATETFAEEWLGQPGAGPDYLTAHHPSQSAAVPAVLPQTAQTPFAASDYDWTGTYAGIQFGGGFGASRRNFAPQRTSTRSFDIDSIIGGATVGYNQQFGNIDVGLEGDFSGNDVMGSAHRPNPNYTYQTTNPWLATLRPRVGYAFGNIMPYATGGFALGDIDSFSHFNPTSAVGSDSIRTVPGWTAGTGIETALSPKWTIKAEYLYVQLADADVRLAGTATRTSFDEHIARVGLNYRLADPDDKTSQTPSGPKTSKSSEELRSLRTLTGGEIGIQGSHTNYHEPSNSVDYEGNKGGIEAIGTVALGEGWFSSGNARFADGFVKYSDKMDNISNKNPSDDYIWEFRGLLGRDILFDKIDFSPYSGFGYRYIMDELKGPVTNPSFTSNYNLTREYYYIPVGVTPRFRMTDESRLSPNIEYDYLVHGLETGYRGETGDGETTNYHVQHTGYGLRGNLMYEFTSWSFGPFFEYWNINQSDVGCNNKGCNIEPHNETEEYGIQARYRF